MQKLPVKSTDRNSNSNKVNFKKEELNKNPANSKAKIFLIVILIVISIVVGTGVCTAIIYFGFFSKESNENNYSETYFYAETSDKSKSKKITQNNKISYKCTDIVANCDECKEITIKNSYNQTEKENNESDIITNEKTTLSTIVCTSCNSGFYPIYNEQNLIIFCNKKCQIGDSELCKNCDSENQNQCGECNNGFYLPIDDMVKSKCKKCSDLIENCEECYGAKNSIICKKCNSNYFLSIEKNKCEPKCKTGESSFCKSCDEKTNDCNACNKGYFLPSDENDKSKCKKCSDINDKCEECYGTKNNVKCLSCKNGYLPFYNENNEIIECNPLCQIGQNDFCKSCDFKNNKCSSCNEGYYLPTDDLYKLKCKKCEDIVKNCKKCFGEINSVTCEDFINQNNINKFEYKCQTGPEEKCLTCDRSKDICNSCNIGYYLPSDNETKLECKKCSLKNCQICEGTIDDNICISCINGFSPVIQNGEIIECKQNCEITSENKKEICFEFCKEENNFIWNYSDGNE